MKNSSNYLQLILSGVILVLLSGCSRSSNIAAYPIGGVWNVPVEEGEADWDTASALAKEQHTGFSQANEDAGFTVYTFSEGNRKDNVQTAVRSMVEGQAEGPGIDPVIAVLGATSNEGTARAAALANFFNVPMLVPSASGDNLLPSNNLWAFQLSASNSAYAEYLLGSVLTQRTIALGSDLEDDVTPEVRIAILYEQNTYGENAAVATATEALQQEFEIAVYEKFPAENPDPARLRTLVNQVVDQDVQIIFLISSQPDIARQVVETITDMLDPGSMPILIGLAAGFTSQEFADFYLAENVYVLRQKIDRSDCPEEIDTLYAAQNYAAVKLLQYAIEEAPSLESDKNKLFFARETDLGTQRENLRDVLKAVDVEIPCLGPTAFDNAGHHKYPQFEIVKVADGESRIVPPGELIAIVQLKLGLIIIE